MIDGQSYRLPEDLANAVNGSLEEWKKENKVERLWQKDATLWTGTDEGNWLGWLTIVEEQLANVGALT